MFTKIKKTSWWKVAENTFWMIFDKVFMLALNLLVTIKIANYYGSTNYGLYQYAASIVALIEILVTFVDGRVVKKQYIAVKAEDVVVTATVSRLLFSVISFILGVFVILLLKFERILACVFILLLFNAIFSNLRFGMVNRLEYLLESRKVVLTSNFAFLVGGILQLAAVHYRCSITIIAIINVFTSLINLTIIFILYKKRFRLEKGHLNKVILLDMLKESLPLAVAASCSTIYTRCDSVMLGAMLSTSVVGIYTISLKLINIIQIAYIPIRESVYPKLIKLYNTDKLAYEKKYIQISSILTWIYIVGVSFSLFVLPFAFRLLKPEYLEAFNVYKFYALGTFFIYNTALRAGHYTLIRRGDILMKVQVICVFVNIIMNYFGIKIFGMYGAALATVITEGASLLFSNLLFKEGRQLFIWQVKAINPIYILKS
jgi:O-antigen/teichoic acid export membrane protein